MVITRSHALLASVLLILGAPGSAGAWQSEDAPGQRIDYLTFAQGAVPVAISGAGASLGATFEHAVRITDGDPTSFTIASGGTAETDTVFVYELPAPTTFDRFAVPGILETPSPTQTFTRLVEVHGSTSGPGDGYTLLASGTLETHKKRGEVTDLSIAASIPVRWIKLRLIGGIHMLRPISGLEFSEIIGNGTQDTPSLAEHFHGTWQRQGVVLGLRQDGPLVSGCYDNAGELTGTVTGNILRASGIDASDKTKSLFILSIASDGSVRGVRSTNGSPFRLYAAPVAPPGVSTKCSQPPPPTIGCGSVIHGINFDFDSADIRPESEPILRQLFLSLQADRSASIVIEGHTSSEGTTDYNLRLSQRRAQAIVADLVKRGLAAGRISAAGAGEARPIAGNNDESGRSLNRRVEVTCR